MSVHSEIGMVDPYGKKLTSGHRFREDRIIFDRFMAIYLFEDSTCGRRSHIPRYACFI